MRENGRLDGIPQTRVSQNRLVSVQEMILDTTWMNTFSRNSYALRLICIRKIYTNYDLMDIIALG